MTASFTIILLAPDADPVKEVLTELSESGMIDDLLFIDEESNCELLSEGKIETVELRPFIATMYLEILRVIRVSLTGMPIADAHAGVVDTMTAQLPSDITIEKGSIVAPLDDVKISVEAFRPFWNYNLIVKPEDSAGEKGFIARPLEDIDRQAAIATSVVGLCGGLWRWLDGGVLDNGVFRDNDVDVAPYDARAGETSVRLIRATTRIVDAGDLAMQAIGAALNSQSEFPPATGCERHGEPLTLVAATTAALIPDEGKSRIGFKYEPYPDPVSEPRTPIGILQAIKLFVVEVGRELRIMPAKAMDSGIKGVKTRVENIVQAKTFGVDSQLQAKFDNGDEPELNFDQKTRCLAVVGLPNVIEKDPTPTPNTWKVLRETIFAITDGSELPEGVVVDALNWRGGRGICADFSVIAAPSLASETGGTFVISAAECADLGWEVEEGIVLSGSDSHGHRAVLKRIRESAWSATAELENLHDEDESQGDSGEIAPAEDTEGMGSAAHDGIGAPLVVEQVIENRLDAAEQKKVDQDISSTESGEIASATSVHPDPSNAVEDRPETVTSRFEKWSNEREHTLLWQLSTRLMSEQEMALADIVATGDQLKSLIQQLAIAEQEVKQKRKRFRNWCIGILMLAVLGLAVGVVGITAAIIVGPLVWLGFALLSLLGALWGMVRVARQRVTDRNRLKQLETLPELVMQRHAKASHEYQRLAELDNQLQEWAKVIAISLHRPLGTVPLETVTPWTTSVKALSFVSGRPHLDDTAIISAKSQVIVKIASRGWLARSYLEQAELIVGNYQKKFGVPAITEVQPESDDQWSRQPFTVVPGASENEMIAFHYPRVHFANAYGAGEAVDAYRKTLIGQLKDDLFLGGALAMIGSVECDVEDLNRDPRTGDVRAPEEFLKPPLEWANSPSFSSMLNDANYAEGVTVRSFVGITSGIQYEPGIRGAVEVPISIVGDRLTMASFRLDMSRAIDPAHVRMIQTKQNPDPDENLAPDSPTPRSGPR